MAQPALRTALERFFDEPRLGQLCRDALGLDLTTITADPDLAARIEALLQHCRERHLLDALHDAVCFFEPAAREGLATEQQEGSREPQLLAQTQWGPFLIQEHLGSGPTGDCYRALRGDRGVRLKVLHTAISPDALQRVLTHARLLNRLATHGLPKAVDAGAVAGRSFIAHDWQQGSTLQQVLLRDGPLPAQAAIQLATTLLDTLQHLHLAGMTAGCLTAGNVLLISGAPEPSARLLDLSSGVLLGKPSTPRDDLRALLGLLYEMLSGVSVETVSTVTAPPSAAEAAQRTVPELDDLVLKLLNGKSSVATAAELSARLQQVSLSESADDEAIEQLLEKSETAADKSEKAALLHKVGAIYERERNDGEQALVAYIQALCEDPLPARYTVSIERVAGQNPERWHDVLAAAGEAVAVLEPPERRVLLLQLGTWAMRLKQPDTALSSFQAALELDPSDEQAGKALEQLYRDRQEWPELRALLLRRAEVAPDPETATELRAAAAEIAELRLADPVSAAQEYARVLETSPHNERAFQALSRYYEQRQDYDHLQQLLGTRAQLSSGANAALLHRRVAEIFRIQLKDLRRARSHYEWALESDPSSKSAWSDLEQFLTEHKEIPALLELLTRRSSFVETPREQVGLLLQRATLYEQELLDPQRAADALTQVLTIDPQHAEAKSRLIANLLRVVEKLRGLGDLEGATQHLRRVLELDSNSLAALQELTAIELQQGNTKGALVLLEKQVALAVSKGSRTTVLELLTPLLERSPSDFATLSLVARLTFEQGDHVRAVELHERLLREHRERLSGNELATVTLRLGESLHRSASSSRAIPVLEEAADLMPTAREPLELLVSVYTQLDDWVGVLKIKQRLLDLSEGSDRAELLAEMALITSDKLSDRSSAIRSLVTALEDKPDDRKLLTRLMGLYSDGKDWPKLLDVIAKLESLTDAAEQKIKYLMTLAMVCQRELNDNERALGFYERVLALDPNHAKASNECLTLSLQLGRLETAERQLNEQLQRAQQANSHADLLTVFLQLGNLYKDRLQRSDAAIDAFEAAQTVDPKNEECFRALDELYNLDLERYRDRAITLHTAKLHHNPFTPEPYQHLRRLYTGLRRADPAWCLCRTLNALTLSSPEEDQFYERLHTDEAVALENPLGPEDWASLIHPDTDPLLTTIFGIIEPVVLHLRAAPIAATGYDAQAAIDVAASENPGVQALLYVAGVLDQPLPLLFDDASRTEPLALLASNPCGVVMGAPFLDANTSTQTLVFESARALSSLLPGLRLRHLLSSGTGFKSWLLAAIRLNTPAFPIPAELHGPVQEAHLALREALPPQSRDELARAIAKLLQNPSALDVKQWLSGIDFSADRVGFLLANDLRTAIDAIRAGAAELTAAQASRIKELVLFSVDERYFELRKRLQIAVG